MKEIDLEKTIYELTEEHPELIAILGDIGFLGVKNPLIRKTLGKKTTLSEGCKKQGKDLQDVIQKLREEGYSILGT